MVEVMAEPREDPREHPADAGDRSESSPNPESTGSHESASDPQTIAEQSIPITAEFLSRRPAQREELVRVLSRVCEDPIMVDALVEEIQALSGEPLHVYIKSLENVLAARLEIQGARLDTQHEEIRTQGARLEKQGEEIGSLHTEVRVLSGKVDTQGAQIERLGTQMERRGEEIGSLRTEVRDLSAKVDTQNTKIETRGAQIERLGTQMEKRGEEIGSLRTEVRDLSTKVDTQNTKIDMQGTAILAEMRALHDKLVEQIRSLRHQYRLLLALLGLLVGLGLLGWLPQSCSRRAESVGGAEASQTDPEPGADALNSSELPPEPSAESLETDATTGADGDRSASDPDATR